jgi:hypothetical protein
MSKDEKYTATIYVNNEEGEYTTKSSNNLEQLLSWVNKQAKDSLSNMEAEIMDNEQKKIVESIHYVLTI